MKIDRTVADQLVAGTQSDIRQMINIMSTWSLSNKTMTFDETKRLCGFLMNVNAQLTAILPEPTRGMQTLSQLPSH